MEFILIYFLVYILERGGGRIKRRICFCYLFMFDMLRNVGDLSIIWLVICFYFVIIDNIDFEIINFEINIIEIIYIY